MDPQLDNSNKEMAKAKQLILDGIQDHIVSHLAAKNTTKEMWDALATLYQNPSQNHKMFLKEKLRTIRMQKGGVTPYLTRIQDIQNELVVVRETPQEVEFMCVAINGFTKEWATFMEGISR